MTTRTFIRCGRLFDGVSGSVAHEQTLVLHEDNIDWVGPTCAAPQPQAGERVLDYGRHFVMPGPSISFLLPTRGRPTLVERLFASIIETTALNGEPLPMPIKLQKVSR